MTTSRPGRLGLLDRGLAQGHRIFRAQVGIDRHAKLLAQHLQLLDGRGPLQVGGHEHRLACRADASIWPSLPQVVVLPEP